MVRDLIFDVDFHMIFKLINNLIIVVIEYLKKK